MTASAMQPVQHDYSRWMSAVNSYQGDSSEGVLLRLVHAYDWAGVLSRVASNPLEARQLSSEDGLTPLHLACEHDAPAVVVQSLLKAYPEASTMAGRSNMTPLHVTCSSSHASAHVVRVLLELGLPQQCSIRDVDGDTSLHAACRGGAPAEVLNVLLRAEPSAVHLRDLEGLTPLLRLWVRYYVILGADVIDGVRGSADLNGELGEAWGKTEMLLRCAHTGTVDSSTETSTRILHAASAVDCPRAVVRIASLLHPEQLEEKDEMGRTPLMLAAQTAVFKNRDLSDCTALLEDVIYGSEGEDACLDEEATEASENQPSVIEILIQSGQECGRIAADIPNDLGMYPLHIAVASGKTWKQGVRNLIEVYPEALSVPHKPSGLYPFMLAGEGNRDDVETIYELLRQSPSLMKKLMDKKRSAETAATSM